MADSQIILSAADIDRSLMRISHEILEVHQGTDQLALVGIHTRGVYLARRIGDIIGRIEQVQIPIGEIDITLYRDDWTTISHSPVVKATHIPFSVDHAQVVLVDDVLFTGRTTRAALDALMDFGRPDRIELVVLIDRGHRELPIQANYTGKTIETRRNQMVNVLISDIDGQDAVILE